ncbi:hypothetical protein GLW04_01230 [Halobacillus litoralis]|uniref:Uncharacterized protein n=1 Tax=Halobacillus litoralis TaxID=45668 RepID=A0A845DNH7_9BACI|nr:hypothetical protein [Halobacillus litoralis]MYL18489.1 hypothetical protein [Halobacillus litoralis]MYL38871.1 hypothetical protein [Halobacillus litoralis]
MGKKKKDEEFDDLLDAFREAGSLEETRYYYMKLQRFLDHYEESRAVFQSTDQTEKKDYEPLLQGMMDATSKKEVDYYEHEIHQLLDVKKS